MREVLHTIGVALIVFFVVETFALQGFRVYGNCMEPNLYTGERLLGNKLLYRLHPPRRGDIIVFRYPQDPRKIYVKRVVGLPGETVSIRDGVVMVDGRRLPEEYVARLPHDDYPSTRIPDNHYFVLGDNRDFSSDSRVWGTVPRENVEGKIWLRYWPFAKAGTLR